MVCFTLPLFGKSLTNCQSTRRNIPEGLELQQHSYVKMKRHINFRCFYQPELLFYGDRNSFSSDTLGGLWSDESLAGSAEVKKGCISTPLIPFNAGPSGRAFFGVGLRPLNCWDCGFESCRGHGCLSVVSVVYCQVSAKTDHSSRGFLPTVVRRCV